MGFQLIRCGKSATARGVKDVFEYVLRTPSVNLVTGLKFILWQRQI